MWTITEIQRTTDSWGQTTLIREKSNKQPLTAILSAYNDRHKELRSIHVINANVYFWEQQDSPSQQLTEIDIQWQGNQIPGETSMAFRRVYDQNRVACLMLFDQKTMVPFESHDVAFNLLEFSRENDGWRGRMKLVKLHML